MKAQRKITEAEKKRTARFQEKVAFLKADGYEESVHTIPIVRANILAMVIMLPFAAAIAVPYILQHGIGRIGAFNTYLLKLPTP